MTGPERMDREALLKRAAAVAGGLYVAPVFSSAAAAEVSACPRRCKKRKDKRRCVRGGCLCEGNTCVHGDTGCASCHHVGEQCDVLEPCGSNCGCFLAASGAPSDVCVDLRDGLCASFAPCSNGLCPAGQCCFLGCCEQPLCSPTCQGTTAPAKRAAGGAGALYRGA